jgi:[ribosomal protein S18]-alanine N-acetyltransferase
VIAAANLSLRDMTLLDMEVVLQIEQQVHSHPWTRGNFTDSLASGHVCKVYADAQEIIGYAVLMPTVDEADLLDIGIAGKYQRKGLGKKLLNEMLALAKELKFARVILEVRPSNIAALALYRSAAFSEIGLRHGYYPAQQGREDAIVMEHKFK